MSSMVQKTDDSATRTPLKMGGGNWNKEYMCTSLRNWKKD